MSDQVAPELIVDEGFVPDPKIMEAMRAEDGDTQSTDENPGEEGAEAPAQEDAPAEVPAEEAKEPNPFEFTVKGETRDYTAHEIKSALGRQNKLDETLRSDPYKMGLLMDAAKGGDVKAQRKVQDMLTKFTGADDADGMLEKLEGEEGEFNEDEQAEEAADQEDMNAMFEDVAKDVDYAENMAKMNGSLKARIPDALFEEFNSAPQSRRAMYNLVASGRMNSLLEAFDTEVAAMPLEKQRKVQTDSTFYGEQFLLVVNRENAKSAEPEKTSQGKAKESNTGLDAVSNTASTRVPKTKSSEPDWANMSDEEFTRRQRQKGLI